MNEADTQQRIKATDVARYLADHPEFFVEHPALLTELQLPHDSGSAVSLVERQVSVLRDRNMDMRHRLSHLLDNARDNDRLFDKTKQLILALLEARDLGDAMDALHYSFDKEFNIQYTRTLLFGDVDKIAGSQARVVNIHEAREHIGALLKTNRSFCGHLDEAHKQYIFGDAAKDIGSAATVPLVYGNTFGLLAIGNRDPKYYRSSMGTLFLAYIAEVLNRLIPRYL
ncbi:DUF484 family protein [Gilvimarinus sp. SDUM040013]|uniref:DUF484 family protein n=1 Tax=Gilvimarinus gilvus TaxID=3058038 RepID=A0ABU4S5B0_9GAMM|nr:DUF484 family protein [Gilvimarinus sp. SDUM040013]MDO3384443.1 DUF484 family protein [Gilvimarinus sp. SDUM040013]MDX6851088.1 DUF484 family protein [Gilvimarinus sp. SDUM040013]